MQQVERAPSAEMHKAEAPGVDAQALSRRLPAHTLQAAIAIRDWLVANARDNRPMTEIVEGFAHRLIAAGVPLARISVAQDALHSMHRGIGTVWTADAGVTEELFPHDRGEESYRRSPFYLAHQTRDWVEFQVPDMPDDAFGVIPGLKRLGMTGYICVPIFFLNGAPSGISFATRRPGGFTQDQRDVMRFVMPAIATLMDLFYAYRTMDGLLRIYVGDEPRRRILDGSVQRGETVRIRSAILFADMRSYTARTAALSIETTVDLLNRFFDCLVPPIEAEGGEVLKYMGDGLLAIFRDPADDTGGAAASAFTAAKRALKALAAQNEAGHFDPPVEVGLALHHGEAAYGNVGVAERLDFTVIGPDVNIASRIGRLNKELAEPILMSKAFADQLWTQNEPLGPYVLSGIPAPVSLYRPPRPR